MDKNKLHHHLRPENDLPDHLSWDNMEEGIFNKLDDLESKPHHKTFLPYSLFAVLLLIIASVLIVYLFDHSNSTTLASTDSNQIDQLKMDADQNKVTNEKRIRLESSDNSIYSSEKNQLANDSNVKVDNPKLDTSSSNLTNNKTTFNTNKNNAINENTVATLDTKNKLFGTTNKQQTTHQKTAIVQTKKTNVNQDNRLNNRKNIFDQNENISIKSNNHQISENTFFKKPTPATKIIVNQKPVISSKEALVNSTIESNSPAVAIDKETSSSSKQINELPFIKNSLVSLAVPYRNLHFQSEAIITTNTLSKWSVGISAGITGWAANYKGGLLADAKSNVETTLIGYGMESNLTYHLNNKWQLSTGIEFLQTSNRLNFYSEKDTTIIQNINTVTEVSSYTGNVITEVYEDVPLDGKVWRKVVHHNNFQQWSIPILIARNWNWNNKLNLITGIGTKFTFISNESGKTIQSLNTEQSIFEPKVIDSEDYNIKNSLSIIANIALQYQMSDHWSFRFGIQANQNLNDIDQENTVSSKPLTFFSKAGLFYRF